MLIYDCEIIKAIPNKKEEPIEGIEYCEGWTDYVGMGISVIGVYDYIEDRYRVFTKDNFDEFQDLIDKRDIIVGFNSKKFDNSLCEANGIKISHKKHFDILVEIWKADGLSEEFQFPSHLGYGLDKCCEVNFGSHKSGNGALAPVQWQNGEYGKVIDYCLNDVRLTKKLLDKIIYQEYITHPKKEDEILEIQPWCEMEAYYNKQFEEK
jgi:hypothetical protein